MLKILPTAYDSWACMFSQYYPSLFPPESTSAYLELPLEVMLSLGGCEPTHIGVDCVHDAPGSAAKAQGAERLCCVLWGGGAADDEGSLRRAAQAVLQDSGELQGGSTDLCRREWRGPAWLTAHVAKQG